MTDRFPFPPAECEARACPRPSVVSHWGSSGYEVEHAGAESFLLTPDDVVSGLWPAAALERFKAAHQQQDEQQALSAPPVAVEEAVKAKGRNRSKKP